MATADEPLSDTPVLVAGIANDRGCELADAGNDGCMRGTGLELDGAVWFVMPRGDAAVVFNLSGLVANVFLGDEGAAV